MEHLAAGCGGGGEGEGEGEGEGGKQQREAAGTCGDGGGGGGGRACSGRAGPPARGSRGYEDREAMGAIASSPTGCGEH